MKALAATLGFLMLAVSVSASAQAPHRPFQVAWKRGRPELAFSALGFLDSATRRKLSSGLPQRIIGQVLAYKHGRSSPIAATGWSCKVVYDLWQDNYLVTIERPGMSLVETAADLDQVGRQCLRLEGLPVGSAEAFAPHRGASVYFGVLVELNPLSTEAIQRIRRWLSRASGDHGIHDVSMFGSFASLFVHRRVGQAQRTLRLRSRPVKAP